MPNNEPGSLFRRLSIILLITFAVFSVHGYFLQEKVAYLMFAIVPPLFILIILSISLGWYLSRAKEEEPFAIKRFIAAFICGWQGILIAVVFEFLLDPQIVEFIAGTNVITDEQLTLAFIAVVVAPVAEEISKVMPIAIMLNISIIILIRGVRKNIGNFIRHGEREAFIYGLISGMTFEIIELYLYALASLQEPSELWAQAVIRVAVPIHTFNTGFFSLMLYKSIVQKRRGYLVLGAAVPMGIHAFWNYLAVYEISFGYPYDELFLLSFAVVLFFIIYYLSIHSRYEYDYLNVISVESRYIVYCPVCGSEMTGLEKCPKCGAQKLFCPICARITNIGPFCNICGTIMSFAVERKPKGFFYNFKRIVGFFWGAILFGLSYLLLLGMPLLILIDVTSFFSVALLVILFSISALFAMLGAISPQDLMRGPSLLMISLALILTIPSFFATLMAFSFIGAYLSSDLALFLFSQGMWFLFLSVISFIMLRRLLSRKHNVLIDIIEIPERFVRNIINSK